MPEVSGDAMDGGSDGLNLLMLAVVRLTSSKTLGPSEEGFAVLAPPIPS